MDQSQSLYQPAYGAQVTDAARKVFLKKVYLHVAGALLLFAVLEAILQAMPFAERMAAQMSSMWLLVMMGMWAVGWIASRWTMPGLPLSQQYLGLGLFTAGQALIFLPIIAWIRLYEDPNILPIAGLLTLCLVVGLSLIAFDPRTNFSMLRGAIIITSVVSLGLIVASILFGFSLGSWFSIAMIALAGGSILYKTDEITKTPRMDAYVSAALALFSSIMLMLWYILRLMMARR